MARTTERRASKAKSRTPRSPKVSSLRDLYLEELRDLYNAEQQLTKALPKMAAAATSPDLRSAFQKHLKETLGHVGRLDRIVQSLGSNPKGKKCKGMEGIVAEGSEVMSEDYEGAVMDAALISAAQRVEHYEIAAYGSVHAYAELMGDSNAASLLERTLEEEKETDQKLTDLAKQINQEAYQSGTGEEGETKPRQRAARAGTNR